MGVDVKFTNRFGRLFCCSLVFGGETDNGMILDTTWEFSVNDQMWLERQEKMQIPKVFYCHLKWQLWSLEFGLWSKMLPLPIYKLWIKLSQIKGNIQKMWQLMLHIQFLIIVTCMEPRFVRSNVSQEVDHSYLSHIQLSLQKHTKLATSNHCIFNLDTQHVEGNFIIGFGICKNYCIHWGYLLHCRWMCWGWYCWSCQYRRIWNLLWPMQIVGWLQLLHILRGWMSQLLHWSQGLSYLLHWNLPGWTSCYLHVWRGRSMYWPSGGLWCVWKMWGACCGHNHWGVSPRSLS